MVATKLKLYVAAVLTAGVAALVLAVAGIGEFPPAWKLVAELGVLLVIADLYPIPLPHHARGARGLVVSATFAVALLIIAGPAVAVTIHVAATVLSDLLRRTARMKLVFNAAQYALSLTAAGALLSAAGGAGDISTATLPAIFAAGALYSLVSYVLVTIAIMLETGIPARAAFLDNIRVEAGDAAMSLALAPVAVLAAQESPLLLLALVLPLAAVRQASKAAANEARLAQRFREADKMKADLIAMVSHELRSPLTTILGSLELLRARAKRGTVAEREALIDMGVEQTHRLRHMIDQLLVAARFEQPGAPPQAAPGDLDRLDATELLRQAGAEARARHGDRTITVETNGELPVRAQRDAVMQVLGNLLDNACKYSPGGEPVVLVAEHADGQVVLAVENGGTGIPECERERVFERFVQLHRGDGTGGVGLGLYIARQLARGQHGDLLVTEPRDGQGARFELRLPAVQP